MASRMPSRPALLTLAGALTGLNAWMAAGVFAPAEGGGVVGLLPPLWVLPLVAATGAVACLRWWPTRLPPLLLALPAVPTLAWLAGPMGIGPGPWTGAVVLLPWLLVAVGGAVARWPTLPRLPRAPIVAAVLAVGWMGLVAAAVAPQGATGDEPHYLLIGESVWRDGDLDLANNYDGRHYAAFFPGELADRHTVTGYHGQAYPFHGPGAGLLTLPASQIGGVMAVRAWFILLAATAVGLLWSAAFRVTGSSAAAWFGCACIALPVPLAVHGSRIYPDGPAALVVSAALWLLIRLGEASTVSSATLVLIGTALTTLPWLHLRLGFVAAVFGLAVLVALRHQPDRLSARVVFLAAPVIGAVLLFAAAAVMFGTLDPTAPFRQRDAGFGPSALPAGLLGMLVDQEFGLLPYAPALALGATGLAGLWRRTPLVAAAGGAALGGTLVLGGMWAWWGGQSAPARFLVPLLPVIGLVMSVCWAEASPMRRTTLAVLTTLSALWTLLLAVADRGAFAFNHPDGRGSLFEWLSPHVDLSLALPSLFRPGATPGSEAVVAGAWMVLGVGALAALNRMSARRAWDMPARWTAASIALMAWLSLGALAGWSLRHVDAATPSRASLTMLHAAPRPWLASGLTIWPPGLLARDAALGRIVVRAGRDDREALQLHVPAVPAGRYEVEVRSDAAVRAKGWQVELGRDAWPLEGWAVNGSGASPPLTLAVPVRAIRVLGPPADVLLRPLAVSRDGTAQVPFTAWRAHRWGDRMVYERDGSAVAERGGLWLRGDRETDLLVTDVDGAPAPAEILVESGPGRVDVHLSLGVWSTALSLEPGERRAVLVPAAPPALHQLAIDVRGGFTASELRPGSRDDRRLGVFVSLPD